MGWGSWLGAAIGGAGGFFLGGPTGAMEGASLGSALGGGLGGNHSNLASIRAQYLASRPSGYLTDEDKAQVELGRQRGQTALGRTAYQSNALASERAAQMGGSYSPAVMERMHQLADERLAAGEQGLNEQAQGELNRRFEGNAAWERHKIDRVFGVDVQNYQDQQARNDARTNEFWNSINSSIGPLMNHFAPQQAGTPTDSGPVTTGGAPAGGGGYG